MEGESDRRGGERKGGEGKGRGREGREGACAVLTFPLKKPLLNPL